jgi:hypothetical protein
MNEFDALCLRPVERFLHSVMVIDDQAYYGHVGEVGEVAAPDDAILERAAADAVDTDQRDEAPTEPSTAKLDAEVLVEGFAARGLVCGVMRPDPPDDKHMEIVMPAAARADLVILDWHLKDEGDHALLILAELTQKPGMRLVAVYTFDDDLDDVADKIKKRLGGQRDEPYRIVAGDLVVEVYAKAGALVLGDAEARIREEADLVPQVIKDFGRMTRGIVPSAAVAVIGAIRIATPKVLALLSAELDAGYLGHRILLPDPDESTDQLLDLIGAELRTVIDDDKVVAAATAFDVIRAYVNQMPDAELPAELIASALRHGTGKPGFMEEVKKSQQYQRMDKPKLGDPKGSVTRLFAGDGDAAYEADSIFARAMSLRTDSGRPPQLTLGTIVRQGEEWWICVQPVCHSVRLDDPRAFPLIPAKVVDRHAKQDLIVRVDGEDQALLLDLLLYKARLVAFPPQAGLRAVIAVDRGDGFTFESPDDGDFRYVSQMRRDHAQRLETNFAHGVGTVGLDESEVQRRWREKR